MMQQQPPELKIVLQKLEQKWTLQNNFQAMLFTITVSPSFADTTTIVASQNFQRQRGAEKRSTKRLFEADRQLRSYSNKQRSAVPTSGRTCTFKEKGRATGVPAEDTDTVEFLHNSVLRPHGKQKNTRTKAIPRIGSPDLDIQCSFNHSKEASIFERLSLESSS